MPAIATEMVAGLRRLVQNEDRWFCFEMHGCNGLLAAPFFGNFRWLT
jgi:hypothetical protein